MTMTTYGVDQNDRERNKTGRKPFFELWNRRKTLRTQVQVTFDKVKPLVVSINPRPSQLEFARTMRYNFSQINIKQIGELKTETD